MKDVFHKKKLVIPKCLPNWEKFNIFNILLKN